MSEAVLIMDHQYFNTQMGNVVDVRREMTKTKEQLEEEKKISLSIRIRPLELDGELLPHYFLYF